MESKLINPFINAVHNTMETMIGIKPEQSAPYLKQDTSASGDITGIIGIAAKNLLGSVALSFHFETAMKIYSIMVGETVNQITPDVQDAVGELANIVAGSAKQEFSRQNLSYHISIPTIVVGKNHKIHHLRAAPVIVIPFALEGLTFLLEISMKVNK